MLVTKMNIVVVSSPLDDIIDSECCYRSVDQTVELLKRKIEVIVGETLLEDLQHSVVLAIKTEQM